MDNLYMCETINTKMRRDGRQSLIIEQK